MAVFDQRSHGRASLLVRPQGTLFRLSVYALAGALLTEALVKGAASGWFAAVGSEGGPIEQVQFALCSSAALLFACASRRSSLRDVFALAACGAALLVIRESDGFLDKLMFHGAYKIPAALVGAMGLHRAYRARATLLRQLVAWMTTAGFAATACGVFIVLIYAQIVGQKELWQSLMGVSYIRPVKDVAEEMQEMVGYLLIFFGAIESYLRTLVSGPTETINANRGLD